MCEEKKSRRVTHDPATGMWRVYLGAELEYESIDKTIAERYLDWITFYEATA